MVDIPTLNKSLNAFRGLIESNAKKTQALETKKANAERDAVKKNVDAIKELNKKLSNLPDEQKKSTRKNVEAIEDLNKKILGLADTKKKAQLDLDESQQKLVTLQEKLKKDDLTEEEIKNNTQVQKLNFEIAKKREAASDKTFKALEKSLTEQKQERIKDQKEKDKSFKEQQKSLTEQKQARLDEQKERADAKIRQQELKSLAQKTLNISDERSKEQKEAIDIAKGARQRLEELRTELQSQSIDVKENKNFQKLEADVQKKERAARLKGKPLASSLLEQTKDTAAATGKQFKKYLGPNSFFGKRIGGFFGLLNRKIISPFSGGIIAALKGGTFVLGLLALVEFLQSDIWADLKTKILPTIKRKIKDGIDALDDIITAFTEEGFSAGFKETTDKLFGTEGGLGSVKAVLDTVLLPALTGIGNALLTIAYLIDPSLAGKKDDGSVKNRLDVFLENFGRIAGIIGVLTALIAPRLLLRGLGIVGFFGITKLYGAFSGLGVRLLKLAGLVDDIPIPGVPPVKPPTTSVTPVVKGGSATAFRSAEAAKINKSIKGLNLKPSGPVSQVPKPNVKVSTGSKVLDKVDDVAKAALTKFPKYALLKGLPVIGSLVSGYLFTEIVKKAFITGDLTAAAAEFGNLLGGIIGGIKGVTAGGALGLVFGAPTGPGALLAGLGGGIAGAFGGAMIGQALGEFAFGQPITAFPSFTRMNKLLNNLAYGKGTITDDDMERLQGIKRGNIFSSNLANLSATGQKFGQNMGVSGLDEAMSTQTGAFIGSLDVSPMSGVGAVSSPLSAGGSLPSGSVSFGSITSAPKSGDANFGPGASVNVAPVSIDNSSVQTVNNVIRRMDRGDIFSNNALLSLGAAAL